MEREEIVAEEKGWDGMGGEETREESKKEGEGRKGWDEKESKE